MNGQPTALDLKTAAHTLIIGSVNSGRHSLTRSISTAVHGRGFMVVTVDSADDLEGFALITTLRDRKRILIRHGASAWEELPASTVLPVLVVIPDLAELLQSTLPELAEELLADLVSLATDGAAAGIYLVLGQKRPDASATPH